MGATLRFELNTGVTIAADAYGNPEHPPILFLHGGGQTRHAWGESAERLGDAGWYAVTMDHRGHGDSGWPEDGSYALDDFVADAREVIQRLGGKPVLVGASLGGITSMMIETSTPNTASALVLVDVTPKMEKDGVMRIIDFMRGGTDGFESLDAAADTIAAYLPHRKRPRDLTGLSKNLRLGEDGRYYWHWDPRLLETWNPDTFTPETGARIIEERRQAARKLQIPTLLIRGRSSDVVSEEGAQDFLRLVPHAEYVDLVGAAHMVAGDKNDAFTDSVIAFVQRHLP